MAYDLGVIDIGLVGAEELYAYPSNLVFLNGCILGIHSQPNTLVRKCVRCAAAACWASS